MTSCFENMNPKFMGTNEVHMNLMPATDWLTFLAQINKAFQVTMISQIYSWVIPGSNQLELLHWICQIKNMRFPKSYKQ